MFEFFWGFFFAVLGDLSRLFSFSSIQPLGAEWGFKNFIAFTNVIFFVCVCGGIGSFRLLVFLLNYCWGGGFRNFKLLEKIQKRFAVFADIWTESYIQFGVYSKGVFTFKTHSLGNILQRRIQHKML